MRRFHRHLGTLAGGFLAILTALPVLAADGMSRALSLDGATHLSVTGGPFDFTGALTLEAHLRGVAGPANSSPAEIVAKGAGLSDWGLLVRTAGNHSEVVFRTRTGAMADDLVAPLESADRWQHAAAVFDGTEKRLYLDGVLAASKSYDRPLEVSVPSAAVRIGKDLRGRMDNVRIWSRGRSQREIQLFHDTRLLGTETGLEGDWRFDEGILDSSVRARVTEGTPSAPVLVEPGAPLKPEPPGEYALSFNGSDQRAEFPDNDSLDFEGPFTVEAWVYPEQEPRSMLEASRFFEGDISEGLVGRLARPSDSDSRKLEIQYLRDLFPDPGQLSTPGAVAAAFNALLLGRDLKTVPNAGFGNPGPGFDSDTDPAGGNEDAVIRGNRLSLEGVFPELPKSFLGTSLVSKGPSAWRLLLMNDRSVRFQTRHGHGLVNDQGRSSTQRLTPRQWHHVAAVWDGERKLLFINGRLDSSTEGPRDGSGKALPVDSSGEPLFLGVTGNAGAYPHHPHFKGRLDEVRLWSAALPAAYLARIHARKVAGTEPCLVGLWSFDEGGPYLAGADVGTGVVPPGPQIEGGSYPKPAANRVPGVALADPIAPETALALGDGSGFLEVQDAPSLSLTNFTFEAWVRPDLLDSGTLISQGGAQAGWSLSVTASGGLKFQAGTQEAVLTGPGLKQGVWQHVAATVRRDAEASVTFYVDGLPAGVRSISIAGPGNGGLRIGGASEGSARFSGGLDEIRIWNRPRSPELIQAFARMTLPDPERARAQEGLVAYWRFSRPPPETAFTDDFGLTWRLAGRDPSKPVTLKFGPDWGGVAVSGVSLAPNADPRIAGLWVGTVTLNQVNEVQTATPDDSGRITPTADAAAFRILLHVDSGGQVRLLKEVVVIPRISPDSGASSNAPPVPEIALVTRDEILPQFLAPNDASGAGARGMRIGSVAYDFPGTEVPLAGGVGEGFACVGGFTLPRRHPTNPFRHRYHPDHQNFDRRNDPGDAAFDPSVPLSGYEIGRRILIQFPAPTPERAAALPGDHGVLTLSGLYEETVTGLHKMPLLCRGTVTLNRVSAHDTLNP